jgi:cysteine-rich secretory family protein
VRSGRYLLAIVLAVVGLLSAAPAVAEGATPDATELDLVGRINTFRAGRGLPTLSVSNTITAAAKWMSSDMAANNYFSHTSLDGRSHVQRMNDAGYPASTTWTGENIAAGYTAPADVLNGWINSPGHFAVLTNAKYRAIGVGRAYSAASKYGWYWTADFGGVIDAGAPVSVAPPRPAPVARAATTVRAASIAPAIPVDPGYHARWIGQSPDPVLGPGQLTTLVVALENTGFRGWVQGAANAQAYLGTAEPLDGDRSDVAFRWLAPNRPATTTTSYVGPGQTGWFEFDVRAPLEPGDYFLPLRGVVEGMTWLEDHGIYFTIHVQYSFTSVARGNVSFVP